jgi:hypothetical protein
VIISFFLIVGDNDIKHGAYQARCVLDIVIANNKKKMFVLDIVIANN